MLFTRLNSTFVLLSTSMMLSIALPVVAATPVTAPVTAPGAAPVPLLMPAIDFPPIAIHGSHNVASGSGVEIARELAKRSGFTLKEKLIQVGEMKSVASSAVSLIPMLARNAERESLYRWIGKIIEDRYCFVTLKGKALVSDLSEARAVKAIGVNAGGATETVMKKAGLKNLDTALGNVGSIRKLQAGVIDAWFTSERVAYYSYKNEGKDPHAIVCTGDLGHPEYWIAASLSLPSADYEKLKATFLELNREGFVAHAVKNFD